MRRTPGKSGSPGKWPRRNGSSPRTVYSPVPDFPGSSAVKRSMNRNSGPWGKCASAVESGSISALTQPDGHLSRIAVPPDTVGNGLERDAVHRRLTEAVELLFQLAFSDVGGLAADRRGATEHLLFVDGQEV